MLHGEAKVALRRMFSDEVLKFRVEEEHSAAIDMPMMRARNITHTGDNIATSQSGRTISSTLRVRIRSLKRDFMECSA